MSRIVIFDYEPWTTIHAFTENINIQSPAAHSDYDEKQTFGALRWKTYFTFFRVSGGLFGSLFFFFILITSQILISISEYWVNRWAAIEYQKVTKAKNASAFFNQTEPDVHIDYTDRVKNYYIYSALIGSAVFFAALRAFYFYNMCVNASNKMHKNMFSSVMSTPIRFFDLNPLGRIMNRFSKDIGVLDENIPWTIYDFMHCTMLILSAIVVTLIINYFTLIPLIPLVILFIYVRKYFLSTSMEIKRIDGINRSPIFVHVNNTISGIMIVRASKSEAKFYEEYNQHMDYHTRAASAFLYLNRWFAIRLDWIANIYLFIAIFSCIFLKDFMSINTAQIGIALVYLINLLQIFQWCVRQSCEIENLMTSVERILEYTALDSEPLDSGKKRPDEKWPMTGHIKFDQVSFRYAKNLSNVLNNLSFEINSGEKIGIVGRTGAGKSSIIQALFRMAEPDGAIYIDNVNTKDISLHDLRSKLSIIPQEPTLFIGTIRSNLDPFDQYSDKELWEVLERVQLKDAVKEMKLGLMAEIQKGGSNLSVGQKQLFCLARAMIKKSKILIIDEATANVDFMTDSLVQKAIRECFSEYTVLTIAHRLHTIIDNDRILCLSKGEVENFGTPYELIQDESTVLYDLVYALDKTEREKLIEQARLAMLENLRKKQLINQNETNN